MVTVSSRFIMGDAWTEGNLSVASVNLTGPLLMVSLYLNVFVQFVICTRHVKLSLKSPDQLIQVSLGTT